MLLLDASASSLSLSQTSSDIRFGERNLAVLHTDMADCWLRNEYSVWLIIMNLEQVVMHWNAILFKLFYGCTIYKPVCLFPYIKLGWNYNPVEFANEASQFQYKLWENHDLTVHPVIIYIYLCGRIYASCLSYFSNHPSGIEWKLNWNVTQALEKIYHWHFIIYKQLVLSINISCDHTHKVCLCSGYRITDSLMYQSLNDVVLGRGVYSGVQSKKILIQSTPSQIDFL
jgi:hypothetical protein